MQDTHARSTPDRDRFRDRVNHAVEHHRTAKRMRRDRAAAAWLQAAQLNADRAMEAGARPSLPLPRSWWPLDLSTPVHRHVRYVHDPALASVPAFVAGIADAFTRSGRDWIVLADGVIVCGDCERLRVSR